MSSSRRRDHPSLSQRFWEDLRQVPQFDSFAAPSGASELSGPAWLRCLYQAGDLDLFGRYLEEAACPQQANLRSSAETQNHFEEPHHIHSRQLEGGIRRILQQFATVNQERLELVFCSGVACQRDQEIQPASLEVFAGHHRAKPAVRAKTRSEEVLRTTIWRPAASAETPGRLEGIWKECLTSHELLERPQCVRCYRRGPAQGIHVRKSCHELQQHRTQSGPGSVERRATWASKPELRIEQQS